MTIHPLPPLSLVALRNHRSCFCLRARPIGAWMGHTGSDAGPGMMGGPSSAGASPGAAGFVAGTPAAPRNVRILAGPGYRFTPTTATVAAGETITFAVTATGPAVHEFKVGPLDAVLSDGDAPEVNDIAMMQTKWLTYTFSGSGPFGYAATSRATSRPACKGPSSSRPRRSAVSRMPFSWAPD